MILCRECFSGQSWRGTVPEREWLKAFDGEGEWKVLMLSASLSCWDGVGAASMGFV